MPISPENKGLYPKNWKQISQQIRTERAESKCEFCGAQNGQPHPTTGSTVVLTVAHLDHNPTNNNFDNLAALCQRCHNIYDGPHRARSRKDRQDKRRGQARLPIQLPPPPNPRDECPGHGRGGTDPPCCDQAGRYNGYGSDGPTIFTCPNHCSCHD